MIQSLAHHSPVRRLCRLLEVSPSGYYQWRRPRHGPRHRANQQLLERIRKAFEQNHQTYGSPRITRLLQRQHIPCSQNRVARLMRRHGLKARSKRPFRPRTTDSRHLYRAAPNRLKAQTLTRINQAWVADITYLRAGSRWIYLAAVMDLFSRRIVVPGLFPSCPVGPRSPAARLGRSSSHRRPPPPFRSGISICQ